MDTLYLKAPNARYEKIVGLQFTKKLESLKLNLHFFDEDQLSVAKFLRHARGNIKLKERFEMIFFTGNQPYSRVKIYFIEI